MPRFGSTAPDGWWSGHMSARGEPFRLPRRPAWIERPRTANLEEPTVSSFRPSCSLLLAPLLFCATAWAGSPTAIPEGDALVRVVSGLDTRLFDAYNRCDLKAFGDLFSPDVEFFHDKGGLMNSRDAVVEATRKNICHKVRRELAGTLEVYPIKDYGAIEAGTHRFCEIGSGTCQGEGKFLHIWRYQDGQWQLTRVVSYDHHSIVDGGK